MLDYILTGPDGWIVLKVVAVLVPVLVFIWIIMTVMALHKRDVYFWSLGSTWASVIACPMALVIMSLSSLSPLHAPNVPLFNAPIIAGAILYAVVFAYAIFYNYSATKSAMLAISTSMLQQLAVLGVIFLFLRWRGNEVNCGHGRIRYFVYSKGRWCWQPTAAMRKHGEPMPGPANSFAQHAPGPNLETGKKDVVWFALNEDGPLLDFEGIRTEFKGDRGKVLISTDRGESVYHFN